MVAVSVGGEDVGEVLVAGLHPVAHSVGLVAGERRIDQNGVVATVNECGRKR
jgi:hypothetical protein